MLLSNPRFQKKLRAGAACEDLKLRCPHFYQVATRYNNM
jgi:hypothetical protein